MLVEYLSFLSPVKQVQSGRFIRFAVDFAVEDRQEDLRRRADIRFFEVTAEGVARFVRKRRVQVEIDLPVLARRAPAQVRQLQKLREGGLEKKKKKKVEHRDRRIADRAETIDLRGPDVVLFTDLFQRRDDLFAAVEPDGDDAVHVLCQHRITSL